MTTRRHRDHLKTQLIENEKLLDMVGDHPLMSTALQHRKKELEKQLERLPVGQKEPRTVLFFSGNPVQGALGIDVNFVGRVLAPFQNMVMAEHSHRWHGTVGSRGRRTGEDESRMLLTGLPRGSFGLELTKAEGDELFEEGQLADTLAHVTKLVEAASRSDEDFVSELDDTAPRVIQNLREFLEVIAKGNAGLELESGDFRCSLSPAQANDAFSRVSDTVTDDEEIKERGVFKGVLLESWRFDFVIHDGRKITGKLDDNLSQEEAAELARQFFEKICIATLLKTTVLFKNGRVRTTYKLSGLQEQSEA